MIKFSDPTEVIKARWVRPEDLSHYEEIGIENFKIAGRRMSTDWIIRSLKAFSNRKYDGNLVDIIDGFSMSFGRLEEKDPNIKLTQTISKESKSKLIIDNSKLDGFITFFKKQDCISMCNDCSYCEEWGKKAVYIDKEEAQGYVDSLSNYINDIKTSREFGLNLDSGRQKQEMKMAYKWNPETLEIFNQLILLTPPQFQAIARLAIASLAEENAKKRNSEQVYNEDMIEAFIKGTPGPFQESMREGLKKYRLIE